MPTWDPEIYQRYARYRDRPALDLLLQVPHDLEPREIWDLGCGTGEQAALLAARHPLARVHGLDSSPDMLAQARKRVAAVDWIEGDIAAFAPEVPPDLIFTNAALQWLGGHQALIPHLAASLAPDGVFACQMPMAYESAHHAILRETADQGPWAGLTHQARRINPTPPTEAYYDWLAPTCDAIDIWSTTYLHALAGEDPVVEWMRGTALRPYLDALAGDAQLEPFLAAFRARIAQAFPPRADGVTLFPFSRLFILARRR
jgi:trans-aconitate 2-methyltransferase